MFSNKLCIAWNLKFSQWCCWRFKSSGMWHHVSRRVAPHRLRIILPSTMAKQPLPERYPLSPSSHAGYQMVISYVLWQHILYILESNSHPFYSFRGLKNQMRIRIAFRLDSRSWAGFWKNDKSRCTCRKNNTIQQFIILFIYNII